MNQDCIGEPVSWLKLERFALDELAPAEREAVTQHIERCPACRACLETIRSAPQPVLRPLPRPERSRRSFWLLPSVAAVAAAVMLFVLWPAPLSQREFPGRHLAVKGGELALSLVRERERGTLQDPGVFAPGDRLKALVTCPPPANPQVELAVFQGSEVFFPLPRQSIACGNLVALPGAFQLSGGTEAWVCIVVGDPPPQEEIGRAPVLPARTVCTHLAPVGF